MTGQLTGLMSVGVTDKISSNASHFSIFCSEFKKSGLLNGKNGKTAATNVEHPDWANASTPYEVFTVQPNKKYRFRMINIATTECRYR